MQAQLAYLVWHNIWLIVSKPDNVPIVAMMVLVGFYTWLSLRTALRNDRLRSQHQPNDTANPELSRNPNPTSQGNKNTAAVDIFYPSEESTFPKKVHTFPFLIRIEFLAALVVTIILIIWSITLNAPLEETANPNLTPNPAKAPWYFLGLQDLLVYFDPWIAGVVLPSLMIVGLILIPYLDSKPNKCNGYYTFSERKLEISTFLFGFLVLWLPLIVIGTFFRGPGWMWFWPWQQWDPHRVVAETNVDLNQFLANIFHISLLNTRTATFIIGFLGISAYYLVTLGLTYRYAVKHKHSDLSLGLMRFFTKYWLLWTMLAVPIKIVLRLFLHIKYIWVTPWFNI